MSEKTNYYLLDNSTESLQMNKNIKSLIESKETENMMLALQFLDTGGISYDMITYIFALQKWCKEIMVRNQAKYLFNKFASMKLQTFVKDTWKKEYLFETNEKKIAKYLTVLSGFYELNRADLGNIHLNLTGKGAKFCIEHETAPVKQILEQIIEQNELQLTNFDLQYCPREIAEFPNLRVLDISGNRFKTLPKEFGDLSNLKWIYYKNTPLRDGVLINTFPHIFTNNYTNTFNHSQNGYNFVSMCFQESNSSKTW